MRKVLTICLAFVYGSMCIAQNQNTQNILLHLSKNSCNAGDVIHFKCYIINNINHIGEDNNLYVLLSDKNGTVLSKDKYPVFNSSANGIIKVPKELVSGKYTIAVFTPYLINNKTIKYNELIVRNIVQPSNNATILLKAYYDNNKLISNIPNTFYVQTEDNNSLPTSSKVVITDKDGKEVKQFSTDENGVAKVSFTPLRNQDYHFNIGNNKYALPKADSAGINMLVSFEKNIIDFLITKNHKIAGGEDQFVINAYQKNLLVYTTNFSFESYASISSGVNVAALPTGIINIELQNKDKVTIASKSVYLNNPKNFDDPTFKMSTNNGLNKSLYDLQFNQAANKYLSASIEKVSLLNATSISDFDFYYTKNNDKQEDIVDLFEISSLLQKNNYLVIKPTVKVQQSANRLFTKISDDYGTIIKGKVYEPTNNKILGNGFLNFTYEKTDSTYNYTAKVKSDGSFVLDSLFFSGTQKFNYQYYNSDKREINSSIIIAENGNEIMLDSILTHGYGFKLPIKDNINLLKIDTITTNQASQKSSAKESSQAINESYATGIYAINSSFLIDNIKNPIKDGNMNGANFIKNRIPNIAFQGGNIVNTKNISMGSGAFWVIGVVIDEIPVSLTDLNVLTAADIAIVKFFEPGHVSVASSTPGGIIAVYTKNRVLGGVKSNEKLSFTPKKMAPQEFDYTGFAEWMPYLAKKVSSSTNTAYWNPSINLLKNQNIFSFETDKLEAGAIYKLCIRGYNELGKLINIEKVLKN